MRSERKKESGKRGDSDERKNKMMGTKKLLNNTFSLLLRCSLNLFQFKFQPWQCRKIHGNNGSIDGTITSHITRNSIADVAFYMQNKWEKWGKRINNNFSTFFVCILSCGGIFFHLILMDFMWINGKLRNNIKCNKRIDPRNFTIFGHIKEQSKNLFFSFPFLFTFSIR